MRKSNIEIIYPSRKNGKRYAPETMPFVYSAACLMVIVQQIDEAKGIYQKIVNCYELPEMVSMFDAMIQRMPLQQESVKELLETNKDKKSLERIMLFWEKQKKKVVGDFGWIKPWADVEHNELKSKDFKYWFDLVDELIKVGFNSKDNQRKGKYKVNIKKAEPLLLAILYRSYADYRGAELIVDANGIIGMRDGGKFYDLSKVFNVKLGSRRWRRDATRLKKAGYTLTHDKIINRIAETWYKCRIVYPSVEKYVDAQSFEGNLLELKNVEKEVKLCDDALGYKRK